ncbi:hypothetical protein [Alterisphingorhabdus coralli]|uniref:Uncharacterized protein n=1 Tax=Alterisphingorhabdus coralli TaxID=3071408 RepID=A0AA97HZU4_9SPHN|nr:hypothetical protein [Parasphingorhabdus sp. SCSIO 66989]WOE75109.1 hypothetical protein RB602_14960 [Parasphingorhabdus sp. SCSIO 66989]
MQFSEAFSSMGYNLENKRQDWSAEKDKGVCISLWSKETDWKTLTMDSRLHAGDNQIWKDKPGNKKRIVHARRALDEFDGWIDVVKIDGEPGVSYGTASPWIPEERKGYRWRVTDIDEHTGHIRMQAQKPDS